MAEYLRTLAEQVVCGRALRSDDRQTDGGAGERSVEDCGCRGDRRDGERRGFSHRVVGTGASAGPERRSPALCPRDGTRGRRDTGHVYIVLMGRGGSRTTLTDYRRTCRTSF